MLEVISAHPGLVTALLVLGAAVGVLVAGLVLPGPKRVRQLEEQLRKTLEEHESYRAGVTAHFKTTAQLVGEMTQSYKAVYDHLAYGAQSLCGEHDALTSSVFGPPRIIHDPKIAVGETLAGQPGSRAPRADAAGEPTADVADRVPPPQPATTEEDNAPSPEWPAQFFSMGDAHAPDVSTDDCAEAAGNVSSTDSSTQAERGTTS